MRPKLTGPFSSCTRVRPTRTREMIRPRRRSPRGAGRSLAAWLLTLAVSCLCLLAAQPSQENAGNRPEKTAEGRRIYYTTRLQGTPPVIDGRLEDPAWDQGEWAGDYIQQIPQEGGVPSRKTELKILYDDASLYVAIKAHDDPKLVDRRRGRRDAFEGDIVGVCFDSYFDRRTGFEFDLTAAGSKMDLILLNTGWDTSWDAVWHGETALNDWGWSAEMRIPFSQLRYGDKETHVWGLHSWRWINRLQEEDQWNLIPRDNAGMVYSFGELRGLEGIPKSRHLELLPYLSTRTTWDDRFRDVPFAENFHGEVSGGLDGKFSLASNLTLDFTVNPDFGQVEADPSVLNISAFEVFYEEKRPFFLEGKNILKFELDNDLLFYSRRIGQAPRHAPDPSLGFVRVPGNSSILGAVKLTGKSTGGLSVGAIQSFTGKETAEIRSAAGLSRETVEPFTSYTVARVQQDFSEGNTILGGMVTGVRRSSNDSHLDFLPETAFSGGLDFRHHWKDKTYFVDFRSTFSEVRGKQRAMVELQESSARYFQRPDADHLQFDPDRRRLGGHGGAFTIGKGANGRWRFSESLSWRSPGLELNDLGYLRLTDVVRQATEVSYVVTEPVSLFRHYVLAARQENTWDFGGNFLGPSTSGLAEVGLRNRWRVGFGVTRDGSALDPRLLRGGPAVRLPGRWAATTDISTDPGRRFRLSFRHRHQRFDDSHSRFHGLHPGIELRITDGFLLSTDFEYSRNRDMYQYVTRVDAAAGPLDLVGRLDQRTLGVTLRADLAITPDLTIQYYGNPFASTGRFLDFRRFVDPRAKLARDRYLTLSRDSAEYDPVANRIALDENGDGLADYTFANPDFSFREFRSNLVARWEYRPGSVLFLVWSQGRSDFRNRTPSGLGQHFGDLFEVPAENVFLVKVSRWFSLP